MVYREEICTDNFDKEFSSSHLNIKIFFFQGRRTCEEMMAQQLLTMTQLPNPDRNGGITLMCSESQEMRHTNAFFSHDRDLLLPKYKT